MVVLLGCVDRMYFRDPREDDCVDGRGGGGPAWNEGKDVSP